MYTRKNTHKTRTIAQNTNPRGVLACYRLVRLAAGLVATVGALLRLGEALLGRVREHLVDDVGHALRRALAKRCSALLGTTRRNPVVQKVAQAGQADADAGGPQIGVQRDQVDRLSPLWCESAKTRKKKTRKWGNLVEQDAAMQVLAVAHVRHEHVVRADDHPRLSIRHDKSKT